MTKRKEKDTHLIKIGKIIKDHRLNLSLPKSSRQYFIEDRESKNLLPYYWISEKTLTNIERGYNLPSLVTLKKLSIALEVPFLKLMEEIEEHIHIEDH